MNEAEFEAHAITALEAAFPTLAAQIKQQRTFTLRFGHHVIVIKGKERFFARSRCDMLLLVAGVPRIMFELKRPGEKLDKDDRDQSTSYARLLDPMPPFTVVSNGAGIGPSPLIASDRPQLLVRTKADLATDGEPATNRPKRRLATSAATGAGLDALRRAVAAALRDQAADGDLPASTGARCRESLERAGQALQSAAETMALDGGDELVAIDLRQAVDDLGKVVGAVVTDDILDRIFRRFCIGK